MSSKQSAPPLVLMGFLAIGLVIFWRFHAQPLTTDPYGDFVSETSRSILLPILSFHICLALCIVSLLRTMTTDPGRVPPTPLWLCDINDDASRFELSQSEQALMCRIPVRTFFPRTQQIRSRLRLLPFIELKASACADYTRASASLRICHKCRPAHFKPDRSHHCRRLDRCVLKMDHFCIFANQTIGFRNHKFFLLFLFYMLATTVVFVFTVRERFFYTIRPVLDYPYFLRNDFPLLMYYVLMTCLLFGLALFLSFHVFLLINATTTIEFREKHGSSDVEVRRRALLANVKFNRGVWGNFQEVFGYTWYLWLLPVTVDYRNQPLIADGLYYPTKEHRSQHEFSN